MEYIEFISHIFNKEVASFCAGCVIGFWVGVYWNKTQKLIETTPRRCQYYQEDYIYPTIYKVGNRKEVHCENGIIKRKLIFGKKTTFCKKLNQNCPYSIA